MNQILPFEVVDLPEHEPYNLDIFYLTINVS
jgi:hypothetical protein